MSILGNRLETVTRLLEGVENNTLFADIGSDHAFLSIEMIKRGLAKSAIAADINKLPLEKGEANAKSQEIDMEFILSDGFDNLEGRDITSAAVCGMGGELIAKILLRSQVAHRCVLVLQPMSAQEDLRKDLWDNGFDIIKEEFVVDCGKVYTIILCKYDGVIRSYTAKDLFLGKERKASKEFIKYCEKIKSAAEKRRIGIIARSEDLSQIDELIEECQTQITNFSAGMNF